MGPIGGQPGCDWVGSQEEQDRRQERGSLGWSQSKTCRSCMQERCSGDEMCRGMRGRRFSFRDQRSKAFQWRNAVVLCLALVLHPSPTHAQTQVAASQRSALDELKAAFPPTAQCPQIWGYTCANRKTCDAAGNVLMLNMASCGFSGPMPGAVSGLSTLSTLLAQGNQITSLPASITALTALTKLWLSNNRISGPLPAGLLALPRLVDFQIANNLLTGTLPSSYALPLIDLDLSGNQLGGTLPDAISSLVNLSHLSLQSNAFAGSLPASWARNAILTLKVSGNQLTSLGSLAAFTKAQNIYADHNLLTSLPDVGPNIMNLFLQGNQMQGSIPPSWANLQQANYLDISNNQLSGAVPSSLLSLGALNSLDISGNFFSGAAPDDYCNAPFALNLSANCLSYAPSFACPRADPQKDIPTCQAFCGPSCAPTLAGVPLTSAPLGGCLGCASQRLGYVLDATSGVAYQDASHLPGTRGAGSRNIQKYLTVGPPSGSAGAIIGTSAAQDWVGCCQSCAQRTGCSFWHFYLPQNGAVPPSQGGQAGVYCYLLSGSPPLALLPAVQLIDTSVPVSRLGGMCNPAAQVVDDPHFVGARGTRFDFSGDLGRSFCLLSDAHLHVNVRLGGYLDGRTEGASKVVGGKAVRSWIKEMAILWRAPSGAPLLLRLSSKPGLVPDSAPAAYLHSLSVNGLATALPKLHGTSQPAEGVRLHFKDLRMHGRYPMAVYELALGNSTVLGLRLRAAHQKLQTPDNSHVHINAHLLQIQTSPEVHGILGQTFREDAGREGRARAFAEVSRLLRAPVAADGESGKGFLDGVPGDYETSSLEAPDCRFAHRAWAQRL